MSKRKEPPFWETGINPILGYTYDGLSNGTARFGFNEKDSIERTRKRWVEITGKDEEYV